MSGTGFPQTKFLTPSGEVSQSWRYFFQNLYQATGGGAPAITAAGVSFTPSGSVTVATVQAAIAQLDTLKVPATRQVNGHNLSADVTVTKGDVGLTSVTNDAQTKAAIVPNTAPGAGQVLVGNAGGTAYAPVSVAGDATLSSAGALIVGKLGGQSVSLSGSLTTLGAFASTFTMTGVTGVTFPTSGTLAAINATLAGGGSVTQITSKSTGVTLNAATGQITMNNAALAANATVTFTLTSSAIAATDIVVPQVQSGNAGAGTYQVWCEASGVGSVKFNVRNISAGPLSEALVISFAVVKSVTA